MVAPDIKETREQELFSQLDVLASNLSKSSLQFGWVASELWNVVQEFFMEQAGGKEKKALGLFISHVQERESKDIESRKIVSDRLRVARYIPRDVYGKIVEGSGGIEPTYHQIRTCIVSSGSEMDTVKTDAMIDWAIAHQWPPVADIRAYHETLDPKEKVDPLSRHYKLFVKLSQTIMAESTEGSERYLAAEGVFNCWAKENGLPLK